MDEITSKKNKSLPISILILLVTEFIVGTLASLYQEIPEGIARNDVYKPIGIIFIHVVVALALFILSFAYMLQMKTQKQSKKALGASLGGFTCIIIALISGVMFVETSNDIYAFTMMLFSLGALLSYAQIVFRK